MQLTCGQKVMVQAPDQDNYINGRIRCFFYLTEDDANFLRRRSPVWEHVRVGDRAFHYDVFGDTANDYTPRIFVIGYADMYLCVR